VALQRQLVFRKPLFPMTDESDRQEEMSAGATLSFAALNFHRTIEGIRNLLDIVSPHLTHDPEFLNAALAGMSGRQKRAALLFVVFVTSGRRGGARSTDEAPARPDASEDDSTAEATPESPAPAEPDKPQSQTQKLVEGQTQIEPLDNPVDPPLTDEEREAWKELFDLHEAGDLTLDRVNEVCAQAFAPAPARFRLFAKQFQHALLDPNKALLLNSSMLVTAVSTFETLLATVLSVQLKTFPGLIDASDRKFSLEDLDSFASVADARDAAIRDRVDSLMRESFDEWETWFKKRASVELGSLCIRREHAYEVIQRRHLLVHTGGRVSKLYRDRVGEGAPPIGTSLAVPAEYLQDALDELDVLGIALATRLAADWDAKDGPEAIGQLSDIAYDLLRAGRYEAVVALTRAGQDMPAPARSETVMRVNGWIAAKAVDGVDSIAGEVGAWDVSALSPEFRLAKAALLNETEDALERIPQLLSNDLLDASNLDEWPLFAELRQDPRFDEIRASLRTGPRRESVATANESSDQLEAQSNGHDPSSAP
jgi:hypothetical protein